MNWSDETRNIHEVPEDYIPCVETGILFYKEAYSRTTITQLFQLCLDNHEKFDVELQIVTANGNEKWVRSIGVPIVEDGHCKIVKGLFQDIDEKTRVSKALVFKEQQLRKTFDHALVGMATLDLRGKWIDVNNSLCNLSGYTKLEFQNFNYKEITHPEDLEVGDKAIIDMIDGKIDHFQTEIRYIHKNRSVIWALLSTSIIRNEHGKPMHFVAQINDLTERKLNIKKVNNLLATTEDQNKRLLNFAHIVSHNLRSHYSNLDMLLDIVKMDLPETTENEIFPLIKDAVSHLGETVENLNEVAAINIKNDVSIVAANLLENCHKALASISALIIDTKTNVSINIDTSLNVKVLPAYLDSILLNFLTNAIKYKKINDIATIELSAETKHDEIILKIKNYGRGIDLERHGKKLFGMYKTFHKHEDSRGLGLFITKNQVEALGGKIEVESEVNVGTTFYIYLKKHE
ncbi:MAG: PAS domain S-box protein [Psychroserpens sp.]|uniref:PAS domain-containing sensor histidine kinase n=1 Tax=Psychroserpens sp. TaxID=2020870 RepID=UPI003C71398C